MRDAGVPVREELVKVTDFRRESGRVLATELLAASPPPSAIFAQNSPLVEGVLSALRSSGRHVPDDVALIGFDDPPWAELASPPLTVVRQPAQTIGATAAEMLIRRVRNETPTDSTPTHVVIAPTFVVRGSCGAPFEARPRMLRSAGPRSRFVADGSLPGPVYAGPS